MTKVGCSAHRVQDGSKLKSGENKLLQSGNAETKFLPMKTNSSKIICCPQILTSVTFALNAAYNKSGSQCFKICFKNIAKGTTGPLYIESLNFIEFFKPFNELFHKSMYKLIYSMYQF